MKYVVFKDKLGGIGLVITSDHVTHLEAVPEGRIALGAGEFMINDGQIKVSGHSKSLGVSSSDNDAAVLAMFFAGVLESQRFLIGGIYD